MWLVCDEYLLIATERNILFCMKLPIKTAAICYEAALSSFRIGGVQCGDSHVKVYGDVLPKWATFLPIILIHGPHFYQKIHKILKNTTSEHGKKVVKSTSLEFGNP